MQELEEEADREIEAIIKNDVSAGIDNQVRIQNQGLRNDTRPLWDLT